MGPRELISDAEIDRVHFGNFGPVSPRSIVDEGTLKVACGWHCGSTVTSILARHGLIKIRKNPLKPPYLTGKGKRYLFAAIRNAKVEWPLFHPRVEIKGR